MKRLALLVLCLVVGLGSGWAGVTGTTNPAVLVDSVNWCQFGCAQAAYTTPQPWISLHGNTGLVGNTSAQNWQNLQVGNGWAGGFAANMGLVYNGVSTLGNAPTTIAIYLDQPVYGIGAWIDSNYLGSFTGSLTLLDNNLSPFFSYSVSGVSDFAFGTAPFIGAYDVTPDIWGAVFDTTANGVGDHDFAIGTMKLNPIPEPSTLLLVGPSLLGLAGVVRRRLVRKSQEVM